MSQLVEDTRHFLCLISSTTISQRKALLNSITKPQLKAVSEIVHNVIRGTVPLTYLEKSELNKYKKTLLIHGRKKSIKREKLRVLQHTPNVLVIVLNKAISLLWKNDTRSIREISTFTRKRNYG
jgi:hypothetical protein